MSANTTILPHSVQAKLPVDQKEIIFNIEENLKTIPKFFDRLFYPNGFESVIISAGPSMEKYVESLNIKERMENPERSFLVFSVKHALPRLLDMGIEPDFVTLLDPRPFDGISTHGVSRKSLLKTVPKKTIFLTASMAHPSYAKYLLKNDARVVGWHTDVEGIEQFHDKINEPILAGGTSAGVRTISIAHSLGSRDITLIGFDSCVDDLDEKTKIEKRVFSVDLPLKLIEEDVFKTVEKQFTEINNYLKDNSEGLIFNGEVFKRFFTTGELLAQAQDFEQIFKSQNFDINFSCFDDGLVSHIFKNGQRHRRDHNFIHYFNDIAPKKI